MMRVAALQEVGGFDPTLIAGEEPELCVRLRARGWQVWRLDHEMTWHDAQMLRFGQWWQRARRAGHAFAEGAALHGDPPERHFASETRRALIWGAALPAAILTAALWQPLALWALAIYPLQVLRLAARDGIGQRDSWEKGLFNTIGKLAEALGGLEFRVNRLLGRRKGLIEYK
jgi:GT2 family glycosyltransferase